MKTYDFLFVYEIKNRELDAVYLVATQLKKQGYSVKLINSFEQAFKKNNKIENISAKVLVIPSSYSSYYHFTKFIKSFDKVVSFQWEQILINYIHNAIEHTTYDIVDESKNIKFICWGEAEKQRMITRYNIPSENLPVCGYIPCDFYSESFKPFLVDKSTLFATHNLDPNKKTLLFISSFAYVGLPEAFFIEQDEQDNDIYTINSVESRKIILQWFCDILAKRDDIQIIYRYHPAEKNSDELALLSSNHQHFHCIADLSIKHWLANCDIALNWMSTSAIEIIASQKPSYLLRPVKLGLWHDYDFLNTAPQITTFEEFEDIFSQDVNVSQKNIYNVTIDDLKDNYSITDKPAYLRTCEVLVDVLNDKNYSTKQSKDAATNEIAVKLTLGEHLYKWFWDSALNKLLIKIAKKHNFKGHFWQARKNHQQNTELPTQQDQKKLEYLAEQYARHTATTQEITQLKDKLNSIL